MRGVDGNVGGIARRGVEAESVILNKEAALLRQRRSFFAERVTVHREAKKVFLEVLKPFSSEKGFKPPEALGATAPPLAAKPRYWSEASKTRSEATRNTPKRAF